MNERYERRFRQNSFVAYQDIFLKYFIKINHLSLPKLYSYYGIFVSTSGIDSR